MELNDRGQLHPMGWVVGGVPAVASPQNEGQEADWGKTSTRTWGLYPNAARATGKDMVGRYPFHLLIFIFVVQNKNVGKVSYVCVHIIVFCVGCVCGGVVLYVVYGTCVCVYVCDVCTVYLCNRQGLQERWRVEICWAGRGFLVGWQWVAGKGESCSRHWMWGRRGGVQGRGMCLGLESA